jgi:release factor glutamine methyltransferase
MDLAGAVAQAQQALEAAGSPAELARRDAVVLARSILNWDAATWLIRSGQLQPPGFPAAFRAQIERRARHEPVAYITGEREFYGRAFLITRDVLIPRPETEFVVDEALVALRNPTAQVPGPNPVIADVGTGSGCLGLTLALECPRARVLATDISAAALTVARRNADRLGVSRRVEFRQAAFLGGSAGPFDLIVANPPYVAERDRATLPAEVLDFEPPEALFAGDDGLEVIRALLPLAAAALSPAGTLVMEIGQGQEAAVTVLVNRTRGLGVRHVRSDLQGIPRVIVVEAT